MASSRLTTSKWTPPGVYLGRRSLPRPTPPSGSRKICLIGRGSRLQNILDTEVIRSKVFNEGMTFFQVGSGTPDTASLYEAILGHRSNLDKTVAFLFKHNGEPVGPANWQFVEVTDINGDGLGYAQSIELIASAYSRDEVYTLTYQSIDRDILDPLPWHPPLDMRQFLYSGDQPQSYQYNEFVDFMVTMNATNPFDLTTDSGALPLLQTLKTRTPTAPPTPAITEFVLDIANHNAGTYQFIVDAASYQVAGPTDGKIIYVLMFKQYGTFVYNPIGNFTADIPASLAGNINLVINSQLTTNFTAAESNVLAGTLGYTFYLNVLPFGQLAYHSDFFDLGDRPLYTAKDTRTVDFTVASVIGKDPLVPHVLGDIPDIVNYTFTSSTQEGGYGIFSVSRPGTAGGGAAIIINAAIQAEVTAASAETYPVSNGNTIFVVVNRTTIQTVTLAGVTPGFATVTELINTINAQVTGATAVSVAGPKIAIQNNIGGNDHQVQVVGGTAVGVGLIDFPDTESAGADATLVDATADLGDAFIGRTLIISNAVSADNNGPFTITGVTIPGGTITFRNDKAVFEALPAAGTWLITSPEPNFDRAPFRDGIVFTLDNPQNCVAGQHTQLTITNEHTIDWSLVKHLTEIMDSTVVYTDRVGIVTGVAAASYIMLADVPIISVTQPLTVRDKSNAVMFTITTTTDSRLRLDADGEPTSIIRIPGYDATVNGTLTVDYFSRGAEPSPGQVYYFSSSVLRPITNYNTVVDLVSPDDAANFLAPSQIDNHLYIAAKIAYNQVPAPTTISIVQVFDADQDGIFTTADFKTAITASLGDSAITDRNVLNHFESILDAKTVTIAANDPFVKKWALQWNGMPVNAPIGSAKVPDSIVYTATKTLQVQGDNCGRGAFILIPNRWAKYTIQLNDGTQQQVTLDGSFLGVAAAAKTQGFARPTQTILRQSVDGFDQIEVFSDTDLQSIGPASTCYIQAQGSGYIWGESVTVDTSEPALNEISGRTQEQFVNHYMVTEVDAAMVGVVADSPDQLAAQTQTFVANVLLSLHSQKFIADWTNDDGTTRPFNTTSDVQAVTDENDPRQVYFNYFWDAFFPGKRFFGLYSVGKNAFTTQTNS